MKHAVLKRAFSHAKMRQTCTSCGASCRKLMLFDSRIVYAMAAGYENAEETIEDLLDNTKRPNRFPKTGAQKYLTPMEAM